MTDYLAAPIFGGEVAARSGLQTNPDPTVALAAGSLTPMGFINVPGIDPGVVMDSIYPLGSFTRQQRNAADYRPSASFEIELQDMSALAMGIRDSNGALGYYTMLFGNSNYAKQVVGMKCDSMEIDIPIGGRVSVKYATQALLVAPSSTAPGAMTYNAAKVFYGYNLQFTYNSNTYQKLIKRVRIRISHNLERGPVRAINLGTTPSPIWALVSGYLKEKTQVCTVSFELTNPLPISDVNLICRSITGAEILLLDQCDATHLIRMTIPDLSFSSQNQGEGDMQSIMSFSAEADANSLVIANT